MSSGQFQGEAFEVGEDDSEPDSSIGRFCVRVGPRQISLHAGESIIGRDETCRIVVAGALVSRRHARILLESGELCIEDLGSTNGTFVNLARIHGRVPLYRGDRIFVGTSEIEVVWRDGMSPKSGTFGDDVQDRVMRSSGVSLARRLDIASLPGRRSAVTERDARVAPPELEALESAERLADRMFELGQPLDGRAILSEPLREVLSLARSGRIPEPRVLDAAGRCALKLTRAVVDARWMDLAVEIHLLADQPMRAETLRQVIALRKSAPIGDDDLIARYHAQVRRMIGLMPLAERLLHAELANHIPCADDDE
jgi:hypothetical protein